MRPVHLLRIAPVLLLAASACAGEDAFDETSPDDPAWLEFLERVEPGPEPGIYVVEGDLRLHGERELRAYYDHYARGARANVSFIGGVDNSQPVTRKLRLSYCVSDGLGGDHDDVVEGLAAATMDWERATDVNFIHMAQYDGDCDPADLPADVYFAVVKSRASYLASAFFPDAPAEERFLDLTDDGLDQSTDELTGTLRHELGHILGLRHEHIRNPIDCTEETTGSGGLGSRDLSPYDGASIMHYDWCPGATSDGVNLSRRDVTAIKNLYSLPRDRWLGRLAGYWHETDYDATGRKDIFWLRDNTASEVWLGQPAPTFFTTHTDAVTLAARKPIPGLFDDFHTAVLSYAQGTSNDWLLRTTDGTKFSGSGLTIDGTFQPLVGNFDGNGSTDILWYRPGDHADYLWLTKSALGAVSFNSVDLDVDGYYHPIVLDYDNDDLSDVVWYNPYSNSSPVWRGTGSGNFASSSVDVTMKGLAASGTPYQAIVGLFNGDGFADILWYAPGGAPDALWLGGPDGPAQSVIPLEIGGTYKPFTGFFDGKPGTDIFWYRPGADSDAIWSFNPDGSHDSVALDVGGDYSPIVGDYDGDARSDILWFQPENGLAILWTASGGGRFTDHGTWSAPRDGYPVGYGTTY